MAVMALPPAPVDVLPYGPPLLAVFFALLAAAALTRALLPAEGGHRAHHAHHALAAAAMVYAVVAADAAGHAGHGTSGVPAVTGALLVYFAGYALWAGARLVPAGGGAAAVVPAGGCPRARGTAAACRVAMGIGMLAMLLTM
jgi:hypothetical protein